jgi:hypothetical protein
MRIEGQLGIETREDTGNTIEDVGSTGATSGDREGAMPGYAELL